MAVDVDERTEIPQPPRWALEQAARGWDARKAHRPADVYQELVPGRTRESCFQYNFHRSPHTIRAMALGNGSGKTTSMGVETDWWLQHTHPYQKVPAWPIQWIWVCQKYQQMDMLRDQLEATCLTRGWHWGDQKHKYTWPNGSTLYVISNDGDWATIQGVNPDGVSIDEECDKGLWRELQMRRRGRKKTRFLIAATATKGKRWMFTDLFEPWAAYHAQLGLSDDAAMIAQRHPRIWMWPKGGVEDNPIHDEEDLDWYGHGVAYASAAEKQVRLHGGFADFNAAPVFDQEALGEIERWARADPLKGIIGKLAEVPPAKWKSAHRPEYQFEPTRLEWQGGRITIYEPPAEDYYAIGADFAQGLAHGDLDAAVVVASGNRHSCRQVAEAEGHWGSGPFSGLLYALGWYYNQALIVGEANAMGMAALKRLFDEMAYTYLYTRPQNPQQRHKRKTDLLGYHKGDDRIIRKLQWAIAPYDKRTLERTPPRYWVRSRQQMDQLRRFQLMPRSESKELADTPETSLKMGAPSGYHDDLVSAAAGAIEGWWELPHFPKPEPKFPEGSLGQVLGHQKIMFPDRKKRGAFTFGRKGK